MRSNVSPPSSPVRTHEGTPAPRLNPIKQLRRQVLATLLFEDSFYESGNAIANSIKSLVTQCKPDDVAQLAVDAREKMYLRHVPLFLVRELARVKGNGSLVEDTLAIVIQRPDELGEYLALYWASETCSTCRGLKMVVEPACTVGKRRFKASRKPCDACRGTGSVMNTDAPLSAGSKRGLARAMTKFNEYSLAKYNRKDAFRLADVLRLTHPKASGHGNVVIKKFSEWATGVDPQSHSVMRHESGQAATFGRLLRDELKTPDTWETELSAGKDKKATFERLLREQKLGGLAFLRNLRNMIDAKVDVALIRERFTGDFSKVLPFRFISAARYAPRLEPEIEAAMLRAVTELPKMLGTTALVIDTSPSMWQANVSARSELSRFDAAAALAILARELCEHVHVWAFNHKSHEVVARRGFALRDALNVTKGDASIGGLAVADANARGYDRIIVLTDGQWHYMPNGRPYDGGGWRSGLQDGRAQEVSPAPLTPKAYMINVAPEKHGFGSGEWESIDGWSERILDYIMALEREPLN